MAAYLFPKVVGGRHGEVVCSLVKLNIFHKVGKHVVHLDKTYWRVGSKKKELLIG